MEFVAVSTDQQVLAVEKLAVEIWTRHYEPIIGIEQINYMLSRFQSREAISSQVKDGALYYILQDDGKDTGYISVVPDIETGSMFLSKIYVSEGSRGKGLGTAAIQFIEDLCADKGLNTIWLTVNKNNRTSIDFYLNNGFSITGALVQDIGGGFVMDDYRLEKVLSRRD